MLFDQFTTEYDKRTSRTYSPRELFDSLSLSEQTTFDAVTHALLQSSLTDQAGNALGSPIDLLQGIDRIAGQYAGRGSDQQFRVYVRLTPDARDVLEKSREFFRDHENTVYHVGYPYSYRQTGKEPNMQFSLSEDGRRADIDVDYRSSRSPQALFNGHLTAANSDVRVGKNPRLHNGRWNGFVAWWQDVFGRLDDASEPRPDLLFANRPSVPTPVPPDRPLGAAPERIEDAVQEFLTDWLVRRQYDQALDVLSPQAYACLNVDDDAESESLAADEARARLRELMEYAVDEMDNPSEPVGCDRGGGATGSLPDDRAAGVQPGIHAHARHRSGSQAIPVRADRDARGAARLLRRRVHFPPRERRNLGAAVESRGKPMAARLVSPDDAVRIGDSQPPTFRVPPDILCRLAPSGCRLDSSDACNPPACIACAHRRSRPRLVRSLLSGSRDPLTLSIAAARGECSD